MRKRDLVEFLYSYMNTHAIGKKINTRQFIEIMVKGICEAGLVPKYKKEYIDFNNIKNCIVTEVNEWEKE